MQPISVAIDSKGIDKVNQNCRKIPVNELNFPKLTN